MQQINEFFQNNPTLGNIIQLLFSILIASVAVSFLLRGEKRVAERIMPDKRTLSSHFVENFLRFVIIFIAVMWVIMGSELTRNFGSVLFQGTAVIAAIAGFAAQQILADLMCGLIISSTHPFEIGDRIELDDGTAGIVKDMNLRHVVLQTIDTVRVVVPNSKLNAMKLTNMSYHTPIRSAHFRFNVSYNAKPEDAARVIQDAIRESPYSIPTEETEKGKEYRPVYFISFSDSSLVMATTVYYEPKHPTEVVKNDINTRVKKALDEHGIEIPYNYVNVVMREEQEAPRQGSVPSRQGGRTGA